MTVTLWSRYAPDVCACAGAYQPRLNARGKLVKSRDPAWRMAEQTRDPGCLAAWIRKFRDAHPDASIAYLALDWLLDDYREHTAVGVPLDQDVTGPDGDV